MRAAAVVAVASSFVGVRSATAAAPLYWRLAPPPGAYVLLGAGGRSELRIEAATARRHGRITLSLLGSSPVRLRTTAGDPAVGVLRVQASVQGPRQFAVTLVARLAGPRGLAITRTVIIAVRAHATPLVGPGARSRWAYVLHASGVRAAPRAGARLVGRMQTATSDRMPNLVRLLAQERQGRTLWVRVELTSLPNSRRGWVRRTTLSAYHEVSTRLVVDTRALTLTLYRSGRRIFRARVGVGAPRWPTPHGSFYIREKLTNFHDPFYGPVAFGTSARSRTLTDWPGGGIVGIHGTNSPGLIPGRISHGCIRLRDPDILRLARLLPLGTPLVIR